MLGEATKCYRLWCRGSRGGFSLGVLGRCTVEVYIQASTLKGVRGHTLSEKFDFKLEIEIENDFSLTSIICDWI